MNEPTEEEIVEKVRKRLSERTDSIRDILCEFGVACRAGFSGETKRKLVGMINEAYRREKKRADALSLENSLLKDEAFGDALTGIPNRKYLRMYLNEVLPEMKENGFPVSLLALDLDHFKWVNDIYGHGIGNSALAKLKEILPGAVRNYDHVFLDKKGEKFRLGDRTKMEGQSFRNGGEEFLIVLPYEGYDTAWDIGERLREDVEKSFEGFFDDYEPMKEKDENLPGRLEGLTVSVGVATTGMRYNDPEKDSLDIGYVAERLMEAADFGAYKAKKEGRNCVKSVCHRSE